MEHLQKSALFGTARIIRNLSEKLKGCYISSLQNLLRSTTLASDVHFFHIINNNGCRNKVISFVKERKTESVFMKEKKKKQRENYHNWKQILYMIKKEKQKKTKRNKEKFEMEFQNIPKKNHKKNWFIAARP